MNVITDGAPALALGVDDPPGDPLAQPADRVGAAATFVGIAALDLARTLLR